MTHTGPRVVAIVQARTGSTRLPGKVLATVAGRPMLQHQLRRLALAGSLEEIVVATTIAAEDDPIVELADGLGYATVRGSSQDVLGRYRMAAEASRADVVVRITADCPLIDPDVTDRVVELIKDNAGSADYASNVEQRTYPQGLDVEAFFIDTLVRLDRFSVHPHDREHVTTLVRGDRGSLFSTLSVTDDQNNADLRWTVDEEADLMLVRRLFKELDLDGRVLGYREILAHVRANPELAAINAHVAQRPDGPKVGAA